VGGGSSIDTTKAINLLTCNPGDLMDYVDKPAGGKASTAPLKQPVAVSTTARTLTMPPHVTASCGMDVLCHAHSGRSGIGLEKRISIGIPANDAPPVSDSRPGRIAPMVAALARIQENAAVDRRRREGEGFG
jgi:hypothetical protein